MGAWCWYGAVTSRSSRERIMCYPVDGDCWVTYSLVKDMNEALEDYNELEVLTELHILVMWSLW